MQDTWIISDSHKIGTHQQCFGIAQALEWPYTLKKITGKGLYKFLPPSMWVSPLKGLQESLTPPWPDYIIAGGRLAAAPTAEIRRQAHTKTIFLQNPGLPADNFNVVIAPLHDNLKGENVISVLGMIHAITQTKLLAAQHQWSKYFSELPRPWIGILLGGDSKHHTYSLKDAARFSHYLNEWHKQTNASFLITPSRRTHPDIVQAIQQDLKAPYYCWNFQGDNPYLGILGCSDYLCVTSDSVSMVGEACFTGKPVIIFDVNMRHRKFKILLNELIKRQHAHLAEEKFNNLPVIQLDELTRILPQIKKILSL